VSLHDRDERLEAAILAAARERLAADPPALGGTADAIPPAITAAGLGPERAAALLLDAVIPGAFQIDHPRYLAFIPSAQAPASALADVLLAVNSIYGGSWLEGSGLVAAENQALRWLADLAGLPATAGGTFVQGGTNGNLSALHAARAAARQRGEPATRVACSPEAHSSIAQMLRVMDAEPVGLDAIDDTVFAVVATAGTTNLGRVDDLAAVAELCREHGLWMHVDGAYGLAALCAPSVRHRFDGIEHADSFIVDPHKWLFSPFDCCALVYRDPALGRAAHRQHASYLDALYADDAAFNPSDYGVHLTRRARGLPFWFALAVHGTDAFTEAVETTLAVTRAGAEEIRTRAELELVLEPELSVLVFRRRGWAAADYDRWADGLRASGTAFVMPTTLAGETVARLALVNPRTTLDDLRVVLDAMR
jgi:glutamate/tyrosine decarboxylase-like PLP-dependent enzyme